MSQFVHRSNNDVLDENHVIEQNVKKVIEGLVSRKDKSRAVASLLFFEYGIYPAAKTVLKYTKQGSTTDVHNDVRQFLAEIRDKAKVQFDVPMPPALIDEYSRLLQQVWSTAENKAQGVYEDEKKKYLDEIEQLKNEVNRRDALLNAAQGQYQELQKQSLEKEAQANKEIEFLKERYDELHATNLELKERLQTKDVELKEEQQLRLLAQERLTDELASAAEFWKIELDRHHADMTHVRLQLDEARTETKQIQKTLDKVFFEREDLVKQRNKAENDCARLYEVVKAKDIELYEIKDRMAILARASEHKDAPKLAVRRIKVLRRRLL